MRQIYFRAKPIKPFIFNAETHKPSWIYGGFYYDNSYGNKDINTHKAYIINFNTTGLGYIDHTEVVKETVGQYTDRKDDDGVGIYELDIVQISLKYFGIKDEIGLVIYKDGKFVVQYGCCDDYVKSFDAWDSINVLGNVIDNPELIPKTWGFKLENVYQW
jgi:uncharacterized phage protein (TIGR01671 family)